eukprot:UN13210
MGSEQSRHKRRHTVTINPSTPYIKQPKQSEVSNGNILNNSNTNGNNNLVYKPSNGVHVHAYSVDFSPYKMIRSVSTPTRATIDYNASTPNQHLITSIPSKIKANSAIIKKKKSTKTKTALFPFKQRQKFKTHKRFESAIPYIHFNDDSYSNNNNNKKH